MKMMKVLALIPLVAVVLEMASSAAQAPAITVDFMEQLAKWSYDPADAYALTPKKREPSGVPAAVRALDGKRVSIVGLAMPLTFDKTGYSDFILTISQDACAFGTVPRPNEWMIIKMMGGKKVQVYNGVQYVVSGVFHVVEKVVDGKVTQLFSLDAESVRSG